MVTRLLNVCGLYLGPDDDMMPAHVHDNPAGYWENLSFTHLNDDILAALGGSWDHLPDVEPEWWKPPPFDSFRARATALIEDFEQHASWGWKDPRNCLTLPFWQDVVPDLKVIFCLRNPLETVWSLSRGGETRSVPAKTALRLWQSYHEQLLNVIRPDHFITTHYASYFYDGQKELRRVLEALDMEVPEEVIQEAIATIKPGLRHMVYGARHVFPKGVPRRIIELYKMLGDASGPVYQQMLADDAYGVKQLKDNSQKQYTLLTAEADRALRALKEAEALQAVKERLNDSVTRLEGEKTVFEVERVALTGLVGRLEGEKTALEAALKTEREALVAEQAAFKIKRAALAESVARLKDEKTVLETERAALVESVGRLERQREEQEAENARLVAWAGSLENEKNVFQAQRGYLQQERTRMRRSFLVRLAIRLQGLRRISAKRALKKIIRGGRPSSPVHLFLDYPYPDSNLVVGSFYVSGWAFSSAGSIERVEAFLGEKLLGTLQYGIDRPDVAAAFPTTEKAGHCGYEHLFTLNDVRPGDYEFVVRAVDTAGNSQSVHRRIVIAASSAGVSLVSASPADAPPVDAPPAEVLPEVVPQKVEEQVVDPKKRKYIRVDRALWHDGYLEVEGWVMWPNSQPPRIVQISMDGQLVGTTRCDLSRPEISGLFSDDLKPYCRGFRWSQPLSSAGHAGRNKASCVIEVVDKRGEKLRRDLTLRYEGKPSADEGGGIEGSLRAFMVEYQTRAGRKPSILDWNSGLQWKQTFPEIAIFSPPVSDDRPLLPYIDRSIDVVLCPTTDPAYVAEARRVASGTVLILSTPGAATDPIEIEVEWQPEIMARGALPSTSIIIPVYNHPDYTEKCLEQLRQILPRTLNGEIIVVDDHSNEETATMLARIAEAWPLLKIIHNTENLGFINSCNRGAEAATGEFLIFLNNDTLPQPGWLLSLLDTFRQYPDAGAVGGKLIYPDGTLQEAGAIIFSDGSGWNFGRNDPSIDRPLYSHVREVDYCSGALLATRRALFMEVGGFDTRYQPAYYEDADYCFMMRQKGLTVYYQPESVIIHFEGISSGTKTASGVKRYQVVNQQKFVDKWREVLKHHPSPPSEGGLKLQHRLVVRGEFQNEDQSHVY